MRSSQEELNISPETILRRNLFTQPDQCFCALALKQVYSKIMILTDSYSLEELTRSENIKPESGTPTVGVFITLLLLDHKKANHRTR